MRAVRVIYRTESGTWWAESPDVPGYTAVDDTLESLRGLVAEGISEFLEEPVLIVEAGSALDRGMVPSCAGQGKLDIVGTVGMLSHTDCFGEKRDSTEGSAVFGTPRLAGI